ncbi:MAG: hypothetical protein HYR94_20490 [Chloroflexi bacterium]|nr:hypothetical protein [Chloroflexota bacterium]
MMNINRPLENALARPPAGSRLLNKLRLTAPLAAYLLVSLVATWPVAARLQGWVPGFGDWGQNMWALWWTRQALLTLKQSPFFTHYLFYPGGVTLLFHPLDVADGLLALPLYGLLGGDVSYNLIVLLSFVLSGLGVYYLGLELRQQRGAAFVAGLVFTLSPYHFLRLELGHLNLAGTQWIPFYLLFLLKFARSGRIRWAFLAVLFMVLNALGSWYYVIACGLLSLTVLTWDFRGAIARSRLMLRVALVLFLAVLVLLPLLAPMFQLLNSAEWVGEHNPLRHSVDLFSFWVPGPPSTWAAWFEDVWISYAAQNPEPGASAYLGYSVLALSIVGLGGRWRKEARWWLLVGLGFTILALGPQLQVDGQIFEVKLPYYYLGLDRTGASLFSASRSVVAGCGVTCLYRVSSHTGGWL